MIDRLIRVTTALAVVAVAGVAAIISYQHAYELVRSYGESGTASRLLPFTIDGLIWAASMVVLDVSRRNQRVPPLAAWSLAAGIVALTRSQPGTRPGRRPGQRLARLGAGRLIRAPHAADQPSNGRLSEAASDLPVPVSRQGVPPAGAFLEQTVRARHGTGHSQRAIARELSIDRRKVKQIIDRDDAA